MFGEEFIERHAPALFKPLNLGFNVATVAMARAVLPRGWRVEDCYLSAPSNLPELNRAMREEGMVVWSAPPTPVHSSWRGGDRLCPDCPASQQVWA